MQGKCVIEKKLVINYIYLVICPALLGRKFNFALDSVGKNIFKKSNSC